MDQASRLRELARRRLRHGLTVAIVSGKGGVGKSNVAVNLAICLSARGLRTLLVDADMGLANADLLLGIHPRYSVAHIVSGLRKADEVVVEGPGGIRFLPGGSGLTDLADLSDFERHRLIHQLRKLDRSTDITVLDCGAGLSRNVISFASAADEVVVVTTPEPTALTDAYAVIKTLARDDPAPRLGLFVNLAESRREALAVYERIFSVAQRFLNFPVADFGYMVHDTAVELAVQARCPFAIRFPGSNASACIVAMADKVAESIEDRTPRGGFFRRVAGLFV